VKLIDVDSKATLEDFLTLKKRLNLYSFYGNVMNKSVVTRMSLRSDKDESLFDLSVSMNVRLHLQSKKTNKQTKQNKTNK
jgi:hypothetical protein